MEPTLVQLVRTAAESGDDRPWITTPRETVSRVQMWDAIRRVAGGLSHVGIGRGDRVALFCRNGVEFIQVWLAAQSLGATVVPINTGFRSIEARYVVKHSGAVFVLADAETIEAARESTQDLPNGPIQLVVLDHVDAATDQERPFSDFIETAPLDPSELAVATTDDIASILYTSGTTGPPKGCLLGHDYFAFGAAAVTDQLSLTSSDVMMCVLPLFHMNAQVSSVSTSLYSGARLILEDRFSASRFWDQVRRYGVTEFSYLGVISAALSKLPPSPHGDRNHSLRVGFGAGMPPELHAEFEDRFGVAMLEVFGMTETCMDLATRLTPDRRVGTRTLGTVVDGKQVRLVNDNTEETLTGEVGHLQVQGAGMFRGYFNDPDASAAAYDGPWFRTGDLARRDSDGWYYYVDRSKDIIRRAGENIGSVEVETVLVSHPAVLTAAVIGVPDEVLGQEVKALIVLRDGEVAGDALLQDVANYCATYLAPFKVPRYIEALTELPQTKTQKIQKAALREKYGNRAGFDAGLRSTGRNA